MKLQEQLAEALRGTVVVMGIGNPCRGDDGAGSIVAGKTNGAPGVRVIDAQEVPENYLRQVVDWHPDNVVLIDSVNLKSTPGSVAFLERDQTASYWPSTHRLPINLLMNYLERETRARTLLVAIQPDQTAFSQSMSEAVSSSVDAIARILNEIIAARPQPGQPRFTGQSREAPT